MPADSDHSNSAVDSRDIEIQLAYYDVLRATTEGEMAAAHIKLTQLREKRMAQDTQFFRMTSTLEPNPEKVLKLINEPVEGLSPSDVNCHRAALKAVTTHCGPLDGYTMRYSRLFANLCSNQFSVESIEVAAKRECTTTAEPSTVVPEPITQLPDSGFDFNQSEYHVSYATSAAFRTRDLYHLTGHIADVGGEATAHCDNETQAHRCSHTIHFGDAWWPFPGHYNEIYRNLTTTLGGKAFSGHAIFLNNTGQPLICLELGYFHSTGGRMEWDALFIRGPNPRPGPGPLSQCTSAFNQSACASKGNHTCTWCRSTDNVHQLCFTKGHTPNNTKEWSCDKTQTVVV